VIEIKTDMTVVVRKIDNIQADPEMHGKILTTSYWLHVELGKNI
jgi:hypothetical protein